MKKPVKWGIISTANIGMAKVIPGMLKSKELEVVAISSRDKKTAEAAAKKLCSRPKSTVAWGSGPTLHGFRR